MILGIHGSIRPGYRKALEEAKALGCKALQIFSYRRHHDPAAEELAEFGDLWKTSGITRLLVHVRYLPSLASSDPARHRRSIHWLAREMRLASALDAEGLVLHAGAYSEKSDLKAGLSFFAEGARAARETSGADIPLLLENVPGGGRRMGGTLEELAQLGALLERGGIKIRYCLDTAHAWAQGYDIASESGMARFLDSAVKLLGAGRILAFHLNDTLAALGSHRENHWHWGKGRLGSDGLRHLLRREEFVRAVGILETPKGAHEAADFEFVRRLCLDA